MNILAVAAPLLPVLCAQLTAYWPAQAPQPTVLAAQAEQESLWNPKAVLQTSREYGFGLYQITKTATFNNFNVVVQANPLLRTWTWSDRWDTTKQILGGLTLDRQAYAPCAQLMRAGVDVEACMLASFNGGLGGFKTDRRLCGNTTGCLPTQWFGQIELRSTKNMTAQPGYGESFGRTNHCYPYRVMVLRAPKYGSVCGVPYAKPVVQNPLHCN